MKEKVELQLAGLTLNRDGSTPLYRQLYDTLRQMILNGRLRSGQRLPPTRELARMLNLSRNTVSLAYDSLLAEGYIETIVGSGTYVNKDLPEDIVLAALPTPDNSQTSATISADSISNRGRRLAGTKLHLMRDYETMYPFQHGVPALKEFPDQLWSRSFTRQWRSFNRDLLGYNDPKGYRPLREAVADYLRASRAVNCEAEQIIIISGAQQGLSLAAMVLLDAGDAVWLEDPCYPGARDSVITAGAHLVPVPVDFEGLDIEAGITAAPQARMVYVTPSYQFPLGITMSLKRRFQLLKWAEQTGSWILEDDYDSEFRYSGPPLASLQGLDAQKRVIYLGTFSKVLFPALRLGYLVAPLELVDAFVAARAVFDRGSSIIEQAALADFMAQGHFGRHIRRMRIRYQSRQKALLDAAGQHLQGLITLHPSEAGMHLVGWLPPDANDKEISRTLAQSGIVASPLSSYVIKHPYDPALILGYTAFSETEIKQAVSRMKRVFNT